MGALIMPRRENSGQLRPIGIQVIFRAMAKPVTLSIREARALAVNSQLLGGAPAFAGVQGALQVIEHLGYVQIDTISVVARAHHHVLWNRVAGYNETHLKELEASRAVFEYWAHAAAYLPMKDYPFSLCRKQDFLSGGAFWFEKDHHTADTVLERIRREGPLMSKDFKNDKPMTAPGNGMDWARNPFNLALRLLFMEGRIMVAGRRGFQKAYGMPEEVLPAGTDDKLPARDAYLRYLIERDTRAHGLVKAREIGYLLRGLQPKLNAVLREMVNAGELLTARVEGLGEEPYYIRPQALERFTRMNEKPMLYILSPFDNLVIQRKRLEELFGFSYTLECYTPAGKRKFGYFGLPLLYGDCFVGQLDARAGRKTGCFFLNNLAWEAGQERREETEAALVQSLQAFAAFNNCNRVEISVPAARQLSEGILDFLSK